MGNGAHHLTTVERTTSAPVALDDIDQGRTVAGVRLTQTGCGYTAQGVQLCFVDDSSPYWESVVDGTPLAARTLTRLVNLLVRRGDLVKDGER